MKTKTGLLKIVLGTTLFFISCVTTPNTTKIPPINTESEESIHNFISTFETLYFTNFNDEYINDFKIFTGMDVKTENGSSFIIGSPDNGSMQRQYKLMRGSTVLIKFRAIDKNTFIFMLTKKGFKEIGFKTIGLSFDNGEYIQAFEMHGVNPEWTTQKWNNTGFTRGKMYYLLAVIDNKGILTFTIFSQNSKPFSYTYSEKLEDEMWSFGIGVTGKLEVFEYREMK